MTTYNTAKHARRRLADAAKDEDPPPGLTTKPVGSVDLATPLSRPEFLRLPPGGGRCPHTGLSRSAINALILPTPENGFRPPVRSFVLRKRGARTGIRLVDFDSLTGYIRAHAEQGGVPTQTPVPPFATGNHEH